MPTGYTQILTDTPNVTTADFARRCVRALTIMWWMRDDDAAAGLPDVPPAEVFHQDSDAVLDDEIELVRLRDMPPEARRAAVEAAHVEVVASLRRINEQKAARRARVLSLQAKIADWKPPPGPWKNEPKMIEQFHHLRAFMAQQLGIELDETKPHEIPAAPEDPDVWHARRILQLEEAVRRHEQRQEDGEAAYALSADFLVFFKAALASAP
jgi:hypothetical protein